MFDILPFFNCVMIHFNNSTINTFINITHQTLNIYRSENKFIKSYKPQK